MWAWWKLNVPKSYELICRSCFPHERQLRRGTHPQTVEVRVMKEERAWRHTCTLFLTVFCFSRGKWSAHTMLSGISKCSSAGGLCLLHQWHILRGGKREIHNFVKVVDHNLPLLLQNHHHHTLIALIDTDFMHISGTAVFLMHMWKGSNLCLPTVWCPSFG